MAFPPIDYWRYELKPRGDLNARTDGALVCGGVLVRCEGGYGCLQPWPTLGDATLEEQLEILANGGSTRLIERALECCRIDGAARRERRSLFAELTIPVSHATVPWPPDSGYFEESIQAASESGCNLIKIKAGPVALGAIEKMNRAVDLWKGGGQPKFRIDFNETLTPGSFREFADAVRRGRFGIDFVEDPLPYSCEAWASLSRECGLDFGLDRQEMRGRHDSCYQVRVWKPARSNVDPDDLRGKRLVITSSMDHAIGQLFAAYEAARYSGELDVCGLLTHSLFEPDPFFDSLSVTGARLAPPSGPGLGFRDLLESLPWISLT